MALRTTCLYCGAELGDATPAAKGLCAACAPRLAKADKARPRDPEATKRGPITAAPLVGQHAQIKASHSREALAELIAAGPQTETPQMVSELLAADKRASSAIALVPFLGPWIIQRSEVHSAKEKFWLSWISIALTTSLLWLIVSRLPTPEDEAAKVHQRIERELATLAEFGERYRSEHGSYPSDSMWRQFTERADPRFFDPWGQPYRYSLGSDGFTLGTFGRDRVEGGAEEDADVTMAFRAAPRPH